MAEEAALNMDGTQDVEMQRQAQLRRARLQAVRQQGINKAIDTATGGVKKFTPQGFVLRQVVKRLLSNPLALGFLVPFLIIGGLVFGIMMLFVPFIIIILLVVGTVGGVAGFIGDALTNIGHALGF